MTTTTVLRRAGWLGTIEIRNGWANFIGEAGNLYTVRQLEALVDRLVERQRQEFDELLPEGCHWYPALAEIHGPVDYAGLDENLADAAQLASLYDHGDNVRSALCYAGDAAEAAFCEIEQAVLAEMA